MFPLDLPYTGDWFLWCLFAMHHDVAYFAEPMVNYRTHDLSMTNYLMSHRAAIALKEGFTVLWRLREHAEQANEAHTVRQCSVRLANLYGKHLVGGTCGRWSYRMTEQEFESSLSRQNITGTEENWLRARVWLAAGDDSFKVGRHTDASEYYRRALQHGGSTIRIRARQMLVTTGGFGAGLVAGLRKFKHVVFN
jgi:hypothetical protein